MKHVRSSELRRLLSVRRAKRRKKKLKQENKKKEEIEDRNSTVQHNSDERVLKTKKKKHKNIMSMTMQNVPHAETSVSNKAPNQRSRLRGVSWSKEASKWQAQIKYKGKTHFLGCFGDEFEAAKAYDDAATKEHGERALVNFPQQGPGSKPPQWHHSQSSNVLKFHIKKKPKFHIKRKRSI